MNKHWKSVTKKHQPHELFSCIVQEGFFTHEQGFDVTKRSIMELYLHDSAGNEVVGGRFRMKILDSQFGNDSFVTLVDQDRLDATHLPELWDGEVIEHKDGKVRLLIVIPEAKQPLVFADAMLAEA